MSKGTNRPLRYSGHRVNRKKTTIIEKPDTRDARVNYVHYGTHISLHCHPSRHKRAFARFGFRFTSHWWIPGELLTEGKPGDPLSRRVADPQAAAYLREHYDASRDSAQVQKAQENVRRRLERESALNARTNRADNETPHKGMRSK